MNRTHMRAWWIEVRVVRTRLPALHAMIPVELLVALD